MGTMPRLSVILAVVALAAASAAAAQTPRPFPGAVQPPPRPAPAPVPAPAQALPPAAEPTQPVPSAQAAQSSAQAGAPDAATLGLPLPAGAQFVAAYDAGRGQRYYVFGMTVPFADAVTFYRTQLKDKGTQVFDSPAVHMFEVGRFRDETMAFPPGVTVKDWTFAGSQGYPNPTRGGQPARFPTMLMLVPPPAGGTAQAR